MNKNVYWRNLRESKHKHVIQNGDTFTTRNGDKIYWYPSEITEALDFLKKRVQEVIKKTEKNGRPTSNNP